MPNTPSVLTTVLGAPFRWTRRLYDWVLSWADSRHGATALFLLAVAESSFFPVPPDALLIALCMGAYRKWARFALICSVGSILGGALGYLIGWGAFDLIGARIIGITASLSGTDPDVLLREAEFWFREKEMYGMHVGAWAVGIAGFTPIPYKVFTLSAGFIGMDFIPFIIASAISRSLRFFLVGGIVGLLYKKYGNRIEGFIDKYFNMLAIAFVLLLVGGFMAVKLVTGD